MCENLTAAWRLDLWEVRLGVGDQLGGPLPPDGMQWGSWEEEREVKCEGLDLGGRQDVNA